MVLYGCRSLRPISTSPLTTSPHRHFAPSPLRPIATSPHRHFAPLPLRPTDYCSSLSFSILNADFGDWFPVGKKENLSQWRRHNYFLIQFQINNIYFHNVGTSSEKPTSSRMCLRVQKKPDKTKLKQDVKFKIVNLYVFPKENTENKKVFWWMETCN